MRWYCCKACRSSLLSGCTALRRTFALTGDDAALCGCRHEVLHHKQGQRLLRRGYLVADPEVLRLIEQNEEVRRDVNALPCQMGQS